MELGPKYFINIKLSGLQKPLSYRNWQYGIKLLYIHYLQVLSSYLRLGSEASHAMLNTKQNHSLDKYKEYLQSETGHPVSHKWYLDQISDPK